MYEILCSSQIYPQFHLQSIKTAVYTSASPYSFAVFFGRRPLDPMIARPKNMGVEASGIGTCQASRIYTHQMDDHVEIFKVTDITIGTQIKDVFQA